MFVTEYNNRRDKVVELPKNDVAKAIARRGVDEI